MSTNSMNRPIERDRPETVPQVHMVEKGWFCNQRLDLVSLDLHMGKAMNVDPLLHTTHKFQVDCRSPRERQNKKVSRRKHWMRAGNSFSKTM